MEIVKILCEMGADVNCEDRWHRRPLDDAKTGGHDECQRVLKEYGAEHGTASTVTNELDDSSRRFAENMKVNFDELELIDRIGAGAFGEIYKCRYVHDVENTFTKWDYFVSQFGSDDYLQLARYLSGGKNYQNSENSKRLD